MIALALLPVSYISPLIPVVHGRGVRCEPHSPQHSRRRRCGVGGRVAGRQITSAHVQRGRVRVQGQGIHYISYVIA